MEISDFTDNVNCNETGRWVEWLGENLPDGKSNERIRTLVRKWTERDYQSAGEWLVATPESPAKSVSIRAYAETVSRYDPDTATQWANALPPGTEREETLKSIYQNWPDKDTAGKEDFSKAHGIN